MKTLILIGLLLAGCTTTKPEEPKEYSCVSFNAHGVYARYQIVAPSFDVALERATAANKKFMELSLIPDTVAECQR